MNVAPLFRFLMDRRDEGQAVCLVTAIAVTGASTRNPGTHMVVAQDGRYAGSLSGGCIEAAIVAEAQAALRAGEPREVRFGAGSRYIDVRLPCGGSLDLLFTPHVGAELARDLCVRLAGDDAFSLALPRGDGAAHLLASAIPTRVQLGPATRLVGHVPDLRLTVMGNGASAVALVALACALNIGVTLHAPDADDCARANDLGASARVLEMPGHIDAMRWGAWDAIALMFHDHDWEVPLLDALLRHACFYIGVMGSRRAHAARCAQLAAMGVAAQTLSRLHAPIGLIASTRDPETLALSALAQIVDRYHTRTAAVFRADTAQTMTRIDTASP